MFPCILCEFPVCLPLYLPARFLCALANFLMSFPFRFYCVLPRVPVLRVTYNLTCFPTGTWWVSSYIPHALNTIRIARILLCVLCACFCLPFVLLCTVLYCTVPLYYPMSFLLGFEGGRPTNLVPRSFPLKVGAPPTFKGKALGTRLVDPPLRVVFPVPSSCVSYVTMCYPIQGGVRSSGGPPPGTPLHFFFPASLAFFCSHFKGTQSPLGPCLPGH